MKKKKILFINNHFQKSDGTVRALIELCNNLNPELFDISILPLYRFDKEMVSELKNDVRFLKGYGTYFKGLSTIFNKLSAKWLYKHYIKDEYDIEIAFQCDMPTKLVAYSQNKKALHVMWMHGYQCYKEYYPNADKVVCVSKYNRDKCLEELEYKGNVVYCYNLLNTDKIIKMSEENADLRKEDILNFVSVGRLSPEKGYTRLLEVCKKLNDEGYYFQMVIVGDGPEKDDMSKILTKYKMKNVILTGFDNNPHKYVKDSDVFICSSFSEGYSTACAESAVVGTPIISTRVPGAQEIIDDCSCGVVCDNSEEGLYKAMKSVLDDPQKATQWKNILSKNKEKFYISNRKREMNDLFTELYNLAGEKNSL